MSAANRAKGKRWEHDLLAYLREAGLDAEALRLAGTKDQGDIVVRLDRNMRVIVEAKNSAMQPSVYVGEAQIEAGNYASARGFDRDSVLPVAVVKRRQAHTSRAYCLIELHELVAFLRDYAETMHRIRGLER